MSSIPHLNRSELKEIACWLFSMEANEANVINIMIKRNFEALLKQKDV